jgi:hypothetical protein
VKYLLLAYIDEEMAELSPEEGASIASWAGEMKGRGMRLLGGRLRPDGDTTSLRLDGDELMITDGPFAETKEHLAGFEVLECASLEEAVEVASHHPAAGMGTIELRQLLWS